MATQDEPKISLQDYWKDFPEAPFSDTFKWIDSDGFEHMTTVRGWGDKSLSDGINKAKALIQYNGGKPVSNRAQPAAAPQPDPAAKIALEEGNKQMAQEIQVQATAVPPSRKGVDVSYQIIDVDIVEVLPQPDGKTTLKFYGTSDKYPRVSVNKWKVEAANGLMKHVTSEDMGKAAKYTLKCRVYYTDGSSYQTTNGETRHYKDVEHIRPV